MGKRSFSAAFALPALIGLLALLALAPPSGAQVQNNVLTPAEAAAQWKLIFDGKGNTGWIRPNGSAGRFVLEDSALRTNGGDICTQDDYADFEVSIDYRYDAGGNSGIFVRTKRGVDPPWMNGMEVGIQDNGRANNLYKNGDASVYDVIAPSKDTWRGPMKWNTIVIWMVGPKLEHWHNGEKVVDQDMSTQAWKTAVAASKFSSSSFVNAGWGKETKGQLCLQDHGPDHKIWFRNMKIRTITPGAALPAPFATPKGGAFTGPVKLEAAVVGAAIHYTLDGSAPTPASPKYTAPINVTGNTTLKAISVRAGFANSPVTTAAFNGPTALSGPGEAWRPAWEVRRQGGDASQVLSLRDARHAEVTVFDVHGRALRSLRGAGEGVDLPLRGLPPGIYWFRAQSPKGSHQGRFVLP